MNLQTILPPNATAMERALDQSELARIDTLDVPIADLWNPQTCPAPLLPWLAWGVSIDLWNTDWTEATKRDAIAGAIPEQMRKGSKQSVRKALDRIDPLIGLTEWFEDPANLEPYTFRLDLPDQNISAVNYDSETIARVLRDIDAVKPLRAHVVASYRIYSQAQMGIVSGGRWGGVSRITAGTDTAMALEPIWSTYLQTENGEPLQDENGNFLEAA